MTTPHRNSGSMAGAYSSDDKPARVTGAASPGDNIRDAADRQYDEIRANNGLTPEGKQAAMASVYTAAKAQMDQLRGSARGDVEGDRKRNMRTAFAAPVDAASALSYRDAMDRADAVNDPATALRLMTRATDTGDSLLAQALGQRAFDEVRNGFGGMTGTGWGGVLEAYAASSAAVADAINALMNERQPDMMDLVDYMLSKPVELNGYALATS